MALIDRVFPGSELHKRLAASRGLLFRLALARTGDAMLADDLTQDALELALKRIDQLRDPHRLNAWLYTILANCWRHHLRRQRTHVDVDVEALPLVTGSDPADLAARSALIAHLRSAIEQLPLPQREVVMLVDVEGLSYQEVADTLSIPMGTVMSRLSRARSVLHARLRWLGEDVATGQPGIRSDTDKASRRTCEQASSRPPRTAHAAA